MKNNSSIFERRGDPWVSERQGREDFGRNLRTENPEMDQFTRASLAPIHRELPSEKRVPPDASLLRKKANILNKMRRELSDRKKIIVKPFGRTKI